MFVLFMFFFIFFFFFFVCVFFFFFFFFFFSSRRRHTRFDCDWSSDVCSSDLFFTIDNLFIITVCLVMALVFAVLPLMYLRSEGKLPLPFVSKSVLSPSGDRKSTRLNSSHSQISYAVFCLKKKRRRKHLARVRA